MRLIEFDKEGHTVCISDCKNMFNKSGTFYITFREMFHRAVKENHVIKFVPDEGTDIPD